MRRTTRAGRQRPIHPPPSHGAPTAAAAHTPVPPPPATRPHPPQEKLRPELRDEEAALWMTQVLSDSATALMPQVMEKAHQWAQYWR